MDLAVAWSLQGKIHEISTQIEEYDKQRMELHLAVSDLLSDVWHQSAAIISTDQY